MQKTSEPLGASASRAYRAQPINEQTEAARHADRPALARFALKRPAYPAAHRLSPRWPPGGRFLGLVPLLIASPLYGGVIADGGAPPHHQPEVLTTANALPLVNICAPDRTGISYNQFHYFDVDARGVILNNVRTVSQTELDGPVDANPQLTREATLIINEVTQPHPSLLDGFIEVAGQRADVIIANPVGISGCGFINVRAGTLTTGHPRSEEGQLQGFTVYGGQIDIAGKGMHAATTDAPRLIAHAVAVNAGLHSQSLNIVTGRNRVNLAGDVTGTFAAAQDEKPAYALDVAALGGGMYAHKIVMVGTEQGVGVRNAGELSLSVAGRLENRVSLQSQDTLALAGEGDVINAGRLNTRSNSVLSAATLFNSGTLRGARGR